MGKGGRPSLKGSLIQQRIEPLPEYIDEELDAERPKIRQDCINGPRPCPWIMCRWHTIWMINDSSKPIILGGQKPRHPIMKLSDDDILLMIANMKCTCLMDVMDQAGLILEDIGDILGMTRERVRQIQGHTKKMKNGEYQEKGGVNTIRKSPRLMRMLGAFIGFESFQEPGAAATWTPDKRRYGA